MGKANATTRCRIQPFRAHSESGSWERPGQFAYVSHQTRLNTRSKARRPIKVGIKKRGRSGTSRGSNPAGLCCSLSTREQGLVLHMEDKEVNVAARPPGGSPAEIGSLTASNLPLFLCGAQTGSWERPGTSEFFRRRSLFNIKGTQHHSAGHVNRKFFYKIK